MHHLPAHVALAQFDDGNVVVSVRDADFAPVADAVVDVFQIPTSDADLAFRANGTCAAVEATVMGSHVCEIDNTDDETDNDGDVSVGVTVGEGLTVWVWTGDSDDAVDGDTDLFRLDIPKGAESAAAADRVHVGTDFSAGKVHLGSSVVYTVQLQSAADRATTGGVDPKKPASFLVTLSTIAIVDANDGTEGFQAGRSTSGHLSVTTTKITTDAEGKATFTVSAPADPDPGAKHDKFQVDIAIAPDDNAPSGATSFWIGNATAGVGPDSTTGQVSVRSGAATLANGLTFSTEASTRGATGTVTVKTAAEHVVANTRGASNSVTVTVTDQYGDPVSGVNVTLSTDQSAGVTIARPTRLTGRDGTRTFRYERTVGTAATEVLTATWDPDGGADPSTAEPQTGTDNVEWVTVGSTAAALAIAEFDTDTNTIFAGAAGSRVMFNYDDNDRFNVGATGSEAASSYAAFERALAKDLNVAVVITGRRSSAVNTFTLTTS